MNAIIMSDRPKWVAKILNGEKPIEIRKTMPKCELPVEVYIYCTNGGLPLEYIEGHGFSLSIYNPQSYKPKDLRGKVVAKFTLRKVENLRGINSSDGFSILDRACLDYDEFLDYLYKGREGAYAWYISDLVIFDEPKELSDFYVVDRIIDVIDENGNPDKYKILKKLTKAPQSWQYVEVEK